VPKRATSFELTLPARPPRKSGAAASAYRWLYVALRAEILDGRLRPGARLPATRDLATRYALSRGTVVTAFEQLRAEGYIEGTVGSGTYVSKVLPDDLLTVASAPAAPRAADARAHARAPRAASQRRRQLSDWARRVNVTDYYQPRPVRAFRANLPALDQFPTALWAQLTARCCRRATANVLIGCGPMGHEPLRQAVADYLNTSRGVNCVPEQVAIVPGLQDAIDLIARLFVNPGDRVCVENPGYPDAATVFATAGARVSPIPVDDEGMRIPDTKATLAYVTPGHQFPTCVTMSLSRRLALLEWARKSDALIIEDDYDSEFRYAGRPVPALQGLDRDGVVIFAGSFSKVLFSSLRLGYLVVPLDLVDLVKAARATMSRHPHLLEQVVLCDFITEGHFGRHLRRMREIYAERLGILLDAARARLDGALDISTIEAGLQTVGWLTGSITAGSIDAEAAARALTARQVEVIPLSRYRTGAVPDPADAREGLQLGFAAIDAHEIRRGVDELATVLETVSD
jgi:GntR family transcriptional regulator / MocR family aminotransferase